MSSKQVKAGAAYVELIVKDNKLSAGLRAASVRIKKWAESTKKYLQNFGNQLLGFGRMGLGFGGAVGGGLLATAKSFADAGDKIEKMSHRTGMSAEALSELGYAAQLCGTDIAALESGVRYMQRLMLEAGHGSQGAIDKLGRLGLTYQQLARLSPEDQFATIIERIGQMDEATRAAHAMNIFGRSASTLVPLINAGAKGIAEMREEARKLGISMSGQDAQAAADFTDALTRVQTAFKGITNHIGVALAPELTSLANWMVKYTKSAIDIIKRNRALIVSMAKWAAIIAGVGAGLMTVGVAFVGLGVVAGAALGTIAVALKLVAGLVAFLVSPIGIACAAIVGLLWYFGKIANAIEWLKERWASLFSTATKAWKGIGDAIAAGRLDLAMKVAWNGVKLVWMDGINFLYKWWFWLKDQVLSAWNATTHGLMTCWISFQKFSIDIFSGLQTAWAHLGNAFRVTWSSVTTSLLKMTISACMEMRKAYVRVRGWIKGEDIAGEIRAINMAHNATLKVVDIQADAAQKAHNKKFDEDMDAIGQENLNAHAGLDEQLKEQKTDYDDKQKARKKAYDEELAQLNADRLQAEQEFNDAVAEAAKARADFEADPKIEWSNKKFNFEPITEAITDVIEEAIKKAGRTISSASSGTFNAAAIQSLQRADHPLQKIAQHTGETAKNTKKLLHQPQLPVVY